ncbi:hypothetical protein RMN8G_00375 [Lactococcus cremoris]
MTKFLKIIIGFILLAFGSLYLILLCSLYLNHFPRSGAIYLFGIVIGLLLIYKSIKWLLCLFGRIQSEELNNINPVFLKILTILVGIAFTQMLFGILL